MGCGYASRACAAVMILAAAARGPAAAQEVRAAGAQAGPSVQHGTAAAVELQRTTVPIRVDGVLDDAIWEVAERVLLPFEFFPGDNVPAAVLTECQLAYDDVNLYFACRAYDPDPSAIRAKLQDRDRAYDDDNVTLIIDPYGGERVAYLFRITALGLQADALINNGSENWSWDAIWSSAGRITADGYVVEAAIPFKSLRFPHTAEPQAWRFILERSYPRSMRRSFRSMATDRRNDCLLCQAGTLTGLVDITPGRNVELVPTVTGTRTDQRAPMPAGPMDPGAAAWEPGMTSHWGITPSMTASLALNPDFSQVEADAAQLDANTRFALSVPERRPFFLEGLQHFQTFLPLIFTRSVLDPIAGVKVTGRQDATSIGAFAVRDRMNRLIFPSNQQSRTTRLDSEVSTAVVRVERDVGRASSVAFSYTGRAGDEYQNHVAGVDGLVRLSPANSIRFQSVVTRTRYPDAVAEQFGQPEGTFGGHAAVVQFTHNSRFWNGNFSLQDIPDGFRADAGFFPRSDARVVRGNMQRVFPGSTGGWYSRMALGLNAQHLTFRQGGTTDQGVQLSASYNGPRQSTVNTSVGARRELFAGEMYDLVEQSLFIQIRPSGRLMLRLSGQFGEQVDFANRRKADLRQITPAAELWLAHNTNLTAEYTRQQLSAQGEEIFTVDLVQGRAVYHLNARAFIRVVSQFRHTDRNAAMYLQPPTPRETRVLSQLLFSYKINPQTVLFLGYADNQLGREEFDLTRENRTFFMKMGYALRL